LYVFVKRKYNLVDKDMYDIYEVGLQILYLFTLKW